VVRKRTLQEWLIGAMGGNRLGNGRGYALTVHRSTDNTTCVSRPLSTGKKSFQLRVI
jgi:hypothetical protein